MHFHIFRGYFDKTSVIEVDVANGSGQQRPYIHKAHLHLKISLYVIKVTLDTFPIANLCSSQVP